MKKIDPRDRLATQSAAVEPPTAKIPEGNDGKIHEERERSTLPPNHEHQRAAAQVVGPTKQNRREHKDGRKRRERAS